MIHINTNEREHVFCSHTIPVIQQQYQIERPLSSTNFQAFNLFNILNEDTADLIALEYLLFHQIYIDCRNLMLVIMKFCSSGKKIFQQNIINYQLFQL